MFRSGQQIGSYVLVQRIGRGGFGEVWLAERRAKFVTTKVAVKLPLDEQIDAETIKQEATLWEQASGHPNVLPIIDADEYDGQIVIVSEYAPDGSLEQFLKNSGGAIRPEKAIELTIGILSGLEFLHSRQIIHRDLKPANILLQGDTPRLADFGISRAMRTTSMSINVAGTPAYMSPEAFDGKRNAQTDIWSVGVILYQMLAGRLPFSQNSQGELLAAIIMREPEPPPATTPPALRQILAKALAKQPVARYKSAREMREDLNRFLYAVSLPTSEPTAALPQQTLFLDDSLQTINRETERKPLVNETPANYLTATKPSFPQDLTVSREDENNSVVTQIPAAQTDAARFFPTEAQAFAERTGGGKKNNLLFALISAGALILLGLIAIIGYNLSSSGGAAANKLSNESNSSNANMSNSATNVKESSNTPTNAGDAGKNSFGMEFMNIPAGEFMMGSTDGNDTEKPVHKVVISKGFEMGKTEVTQAQWQSVMGNNPSKFKNCSDCPVEQVSWDDAQSFISKLNAQNDGYKYRLPTEAEWEYAARAGTTGDYAGNLDAMAWHRSNSGNRTHEVGTKQPNAWGLYDMHGNVSEWVQDWFNGSYSSGAVTDPSGSASGYGPGLRGGNYWSSADSARSASRGYSLLSRHDDMGFRVVRQ